MHTCSYKMAVLGKSRNLEVCDHLDILGLNAVGALKMFRLYTTWLNRNVSNLQRSSVQSSVDQALQNEDQKATEVLGGLRFQ